MSQSADANRRRILVVKLADLGDAVLATPALAALRRGFPGARIDALTTPSARAVLELCPAIDGIIDFPKHLFDRPQDLARPDRLATMLRLAARLHAGRYDTVVLLHHLTTTFGGQKFRALCLATGARHRAGLDNGRGDFLTHRAIDYGFGVRTEWEYGLDIVATLGAPIDDAAPAVTVPSPAVSAAHELLAEHGVTAPYLVIHAGVGAYSQARTWPAERFAAVAQALRTETDLAILAVGTADEREAARPLLKVPGVVDLLGATSVSELAALLNRAQLVLGADSGVVHLAAALNTPTIAIFGPSNHEAWQPFGAVEHRIGQGPIPASRALVVRAGLPCSPCFYTGYHLGRRDGCAMKTCLDLIEVDDVVTAARVLLSHQGEARPPSAPARGFN